MKKETRMVVYDTKLLILHEMLTVLAGIGTVLTIVELLLSEYKPKRL